MNEKLAVKPTYGVFTRILLKIIKPIEMRSKLQRPTESEALIQGPGKSGTLENCRIDSENWTFFYFKKNQDCVNLTHKQLHHDTGISVLYNSMNCLYSSKNSEFLRSSTHRYLSDQQAAKTQAALTATVGEIQGGSVNGRALFSV